MREFVFDIVYEGEGAPHQQLFDGVCTPSVTGVGGCIEADEFWRIERFEGQTEALERLDSSTLAEILPLESITEAECNGEIHTEVLERTPEVCEVYYHLKGVRDCDTIATLAVEHVGPDVLFEIERSEDTETWAVLMESDDGVGLLYDAIQMSLRPSLRFQFGHIGQASNRRTDLFAKKNLPAEQREALVAAVEHGYYETPRQTALDDLADHLDCPRSTLSYRLRRAESKLAKAFAIDTTTDELESFPKTEISEEST